MLGSLGAQDFRFHLPPLNETAFLLDFDGTLVDIAPTPESVVVPNGLLDSLRRLREACGDALAVVSGRPIDQIDHFLGDVPFAVAGEHGVAIRHRPGGPIERAALPTLPPEWLAQARDLLAGRIQASLRPVSLCRACHIWLMRKLPRLAFFCRNRRIQRVVQPPPPFRRHGRRVLPFQVDHPAFGPFHPATLTGRAC